MFTVTKYIYLLACILVVWSIYVLEKWNGLERWLRGAFEMFPQNNYQAEIFFSTESNSKSQPTLSYIMV